MVQRSVVREVQLPSTLLSTKSPAAELLSARQVAHLEVGKELGRGEGGRVVEAKTADQRAIVLKIAHRKFESALLNEARALAVMAGHFSPKMLGIARNEKDELCLATDIAPGCCLSKLLDQGEWGATRREEVAGWVLWQVGTALRHLHALGFAHGDVKPENIMVEPYEGIVTLVDFGLASENSSIEGGTPRYLPPEVLEGVAVRPESADAYALALTVSEILENKFRLELPEPEAISKLPAPFCSILSPFFSQRGGGRPSMRILLEEAQLANDTFFQANPPSVLTEIRREYLATRLDELEFFHSEETVLEGYPKEWVETLLFLLRAIRACHPHEEGTESIIRADSQKNVHEVRAMKDMLAHDRRRFMGRLIGPVASSWRLTKMSDGMLVAKLLEKGELKGVRSLLLSDLRPGSEGENLGSGDESARAPQNSFVELALRLGQKPVPHRLLLQIDGSENIPETLCLEAARVARLAGDIPLALRLSIKVSDERGLLERAQILIRSGLRVEGQKLVLKVLSRTQDARLKAQGSAIRARALVDAGKLSEAHELLKDQDACSEVAEVSALAFTMQGEYERALDALDIGESFQNSEESAARLYGVRGMVQHGLGHATESLGLFSQAVSLAARAGAALEEATYCTGIAAAASDAGRLSTALSASERAGELFESLDKSDLNGRALLARASVLSLVGAVDEMRSVVRRGVVLARRGRDSLCEAYLLFCLCDGSPDMEERRVAARRAQELLASSGLDDRLRAAARMLSALGRVDPAGDEWAHASEQPGPQLDWWRARANALENISSYSSNNVAWVAAQVVVSSIAELSQTSVSCSSLGPSLVAGAHLALRVGMAAEAQSLLARAGECADHFLRYIPAEYRMGAGNLLWVEQAQGSRMGAGTGAAQLSDVEGLLRSLGQRQGFRPLLNQILDTLLLWTGVERGLLLLRAPQGKLVVRAARNLDKSEISPAQRQLSLTMAKRALSEGRPVVAVDAMQDLSELHKSVHSLNLRSVLAVPLIARGDVMGVAYLDDRVRRGAFGERELAWVGLIGTVAALAIADERDRLNLERALRKARRAESRLENRLTHREAELNLAARELERLKEPLALEGDYSHIVGRSQPMLQLFAMVDKVAKSDVPVMIEGESGTGKELIARAVAAGGDRKNSPFIAENCAAIPEALLESTFFGHKKGAFTGANRDQLGLFELAHQGTLFLDEIGEMSASMQTKLLRVLQEGEVRPLGSERIRKVDVRVLVATHRDLKKLVEEGQFREDLYYRLNVVKLQLPALRERVEDIPDLVLHFIERFASGEKRGISESALYRLSNFSWPGNVRQLENEVRRMLVFGGEELTAADLSSDLLNSTNASGLNASTLKEKVGVLERQLVLEALEEARGNRTKAAAALGLSRFGLQKMTQRLQIVVPKGTSGALRSPSRKVDD